MSLLHCRVCFGETTYNLELYNENGFPSSVHNTVSQYFELKNSDENDSLLKNMGVVCVNCWNHIDDFHKFKLTVLESQKKYYETTVNILTLANRSDDAPNYKDSTSYEGASGAEDADFDDDLPLQLRFEQQKQTLELKLKDECKVEVKELALLTEIVRDGGLRSNMIWPKNTITAMNDEQDPFDIAVEASDTKKRKVGRPRKKIENSGNRKDLALDCCAGVDINCPGSKNSTINGDQEPVDVVVKTHDSKKPKVGRPRKTITKNGKEDDLVVDGDVGANMGRPEGRITLMNGRQDTVDVSVEISDTKKRKVGRPRKTIVKKGKQKVLVEDSVVGAELGNPENKIVMNDDINPLDIVQTPDTKEHKVRQLRKTVEKNGKQKDLILDSVVGADMDYQENKILVIDEKDPLDIVETPGTKGRKARQLHKTIVKTSKQKDLVEDGDVCADMSCSESKILINDDRNPLDIVKTPITKKPKFEQLRKTIVKKGKQKHLILDSDVGVDMGKKENKILVIDDKDPLDIVETPDTEERKARQLHKTIVKKSKQKDLVEDGVVSAELGSLENKIVMNDDPNPLDVVQTPDMEEHKVRQLRKTIEKNGKQKDLILDSVVGADMDYQENKILVIDEKDPLDIVEIPEIEERKVRQLRQTIVKKGKQKDLILSGDFDADIGSSVIKIVMNDEQNPLGIAETPDTEEHKVRQHCRMDVKNGKQKDLILSGDFDADIGSPVNKILMNDEQNPLDIVETLDDGKRRERKKETIKKPKQKPNGEQNPEPELEPITEKANTENTNANSADEENVENSTIETEKNKEFNSEIFDYDEFITKNWKSKLPCPLCDTTVKNFAGILTHFHEVHNERGYVVCCDIRHHLRHQLVDHIQTHLNPATFQCPHCQKCFTINRNLNAHIRRVHLNMDRRSKCEVCQKRFHTRYKMQNHMLVHLDGSKDHVCIECGKGFVEKEKLQAHIISDHGSVCDQCGKRFQNRYSVKNHMLSHASEVRRKWQCDQCDSVLFTKFNLKRHKRLVHHNSGAYANKQCGNVAQTTQMIRRCKAERNHRCNICEKAYTTARGLKGHLTTHTGQIWHCPFCPKTFRMRVSMSSHRKRVHPKEWEESRKNRITTLADRKTITKEVDI